MGRPCRQNGRTNIANRVIHSRRLRWAGHVARMEETILQTK
jgi:hypothetical protein